MRGGSGCGTVFKITPSGALTTIHRFNSYDGFWPFAGLVQASDGNFYGTTLNCGGANGLNGLGTVFKITSGGTVTLLYSFCSQSQLHGRRYSLWWAGAQASDGNLLRNDTHGRRRQWRRHGLHHNPPPATSPPCTALREQATAFTRMLRWCRPLTAISTVQPSRAAPTALGTVFKITPRRALTTLHNFSGYPVEGELPTASLGAGRGESLYGTTESGGTNINYGTVFRVTLPRSLHSLPKRRVKVSS